MFIVLTRCLKFKFRNPKKGKTMTIQIIDQKLVCQICGKPADSEIIVTDGKKRVQIGCCNTHRHQVKEDALAKINQQRKAGLKDEIQIIIGKPRNPLRERLECFVCCSPNTNNFAEVEDEQKGYAYFEFCDDPQCKEDAIIYLEGFYL